MSRIVIVGLTTLPPSMNQLSRQYGILNISNPIGIHGLLQGELYFFCVLYSLRNVCFIVYVSLFAVLFECAVSFCVICIFLYIVPYCSTTARG
jgi:hypothetical protein